MKEFELKSSDGYTIYGNICQPDTDFEYVIYLVHGMCEHKERYYDFMNYLKEQGICSVICDLRGHGYNVSKDKLGYFGKKDILVNDLVEVINYVKKIYNNKKLVLFGHSMGSLIVRNYIQDNDSCIDKLILCGPPTVNNLTFVGSFLCKVIGLFKGQYYRSKLINGLSLGSYNKGYSKPNEWLVTDENVLNAYNKDEYCGFIFTINGFESLFYMLSNAYKDKYKVTNNIPILIISGSEDRVVGSKKKLEHLYSFLKNKGYNNIDMESYEGMRHEILNGNSSDKVYKKVINFIKND